MRHPVCQSREPTRPSSRLSLSSPGTVLLYKLSNEYISPRYEHNFDPERKRHSQQGQFAERARQKQVLKREHRGAIRELRKDNATISRVREHDRRQGDALRCVWCCVDLESTCTCAERARRRRL